MSNQPVPFLDLVTPHRELEEELEGAFREALRSAAFVGGSQVEAFEREFAAYCGVKHCAGVGSGTDAVRFALMASGVGHGDAVVTVSHTFIATVEAIGQAGAATEFVDIDERTYCMSPDALAAYLKGCQRDSATGLPIGKRTGKPIKAVLPVHLYGQVADMDPILATAAHYGLLVIEDACQAHGAQYSSIDGGWRRAGTFGTAAAFSFYPGKNLGAAGDAGALVTGDERIADDVRALREHGQTAKYVHRYEGYTARLDTLQALVLSHKLPLLDGWNAERRQAAAYLSEHLRGVGDLTLPPVPEGSSPVWHLYVVRTAEPNGLADYLRARQIGTGRHYPEPVHLTDAYAHLGYRPGDFPVAEALAREGLSLPIFPGMTEAQLEAIVVGVRSFFDG